MAGPCEGKAKFPEEVKAKWWLAGEMSEGYFSGSACVWVGRHGIVAGWVTAKRTFVFKSGGRSGSLGCRQKQKPGLAQGASVWL